MTAQEAFNTEDTEPELAESCAQLRAIPSEQIFQGAKAVIITHAGEQYRLMVTKNDKLLLQK